MRGVKKREYFIIRDSRALSSGDFSSDTAGGHLKVKGVNKLNKRWGGVWKMLARQRGRKKYMYKTTLSHSKNISKKM